MRGTKEPLARIETGAGRWRTRETVRTALVAVHTVTALMRLLDVVKLLEADERIQVVYTRVPDQLGDGVEWWLRLLGARVITWEEAIRRPFDLVLGASLHQLGSLRGRRLAMPHGAGYIKQWPSEPGYRAQQARRQTYGLDADSLIVKGRVVVDALVLSHHDQLATLQRQCPEAVPFAVVAGDPCYDRLLVSWPYREIYRYALNVRAEQTLVAVTSTWGQDSLYGSHHHLLTRLMRELRADQRVIVTLHPAIWSHHGERQVIEWLRKARGAGLDVIAPRSDWRSLLVAADWLIGDHTSVSVYGAAVGLPLLLSHFPVEGVDPDSVMAELAAYSPRLCAMTPVPFQLHAARQARPMQQLVASQRVSSAPGRSAGILRQTMYRFLELPEPPEPPRLQRAPLPQLVQDQLT